MNCEPKTIYCPKCGRKVATWDYKSSINIVVECRNCRKMVVYDVEKMDTRIKDMPVRAASSGLRFY